MRPEDQLESNLEAAQRIALHELGAPALQCALQRDAIATATSSLSLARDVPGAPTLTTTHYLFDVTDCGEMDFHAGARPKEVRT